MLRSTLTSVMKRLTNPEERTANTFKRRALKHLWGVRHPVVARALRGKVFSVYTMGRVETISLRDREAFRGRLLILKLTSLSRSFSAATQQFVGCSFADPLVHNNSSDGHMGDVNETFSKALTLSDGLLNT